MIFCNELSEAGRVTSTCTAPHRFRVPASTRSPGRLSTGADSPESVDSSAAVAPRWIMPSTLAEISGLATLDSTRLLAHNDEFAHVAVIDYRRGVVVTQFSVGETGVTGDFEGIAVVGDRVFLIESNGRLHEFTLGEEGDRVPETEYDTQLGKECEFEGVAFDSSTTSLLLPCKRVLEGVLVCRGGLLHGDGEPSQLSAQQWHDALLAYTARIGEALTLVDQRGVSWAVALEEVEDRLAPLGGQFLLEWETRVVFVEL